MTMKESTKGREVKMRGPGGEYLCTIRCNVDLNAPTPVSIHSKEKAIEVIDRKMKFEKEEGIIKKAEGLASDSENEVAIRELEN